MFDRLERMVVVVQGVALDGRSGNSAELAANYSVQYLTILCICRTRFWVPVYFGTCVDSAISSRPDYDQILRTLRFDI
jgi:hypothetical protein